MHVSLKWAVPGLALCGRVQRHTQSREVGRVGAGSEARAPLGYVTLSVQMGPGAIETVTVTALPSSAGSGVTDMPMASPPGHPDTLWIGGSMQYPEIFTANPPSNGRAVQRSTDAGVSFTDMTNDTQSPPQGMHPDQHAIAFAPGNPAIAFLGSDGGLVSSASRSHSALPPRLPSV